MRVSLLLSLAFFAVFVISFLFGLYTLSISPKGAINRTFFAICFVLSLWAFGFSVAISAPQRETALLWRRFAALGWGSLFSILVHNIILITDRTQLLKRWWNYLFLYLPAAVIVYVFSFSPGAALKYNLVLTSLGWINIANNDFWDWLFYFYYSGFTILSIIMIWLWGRQTHQQNRKQAKIMLSSFLIALVLGTITDMVSNTFFHLKLPQLAPIIFLIPLLAIFYAIKKYRLMSQTNTYMDQNELILDEGNRIKIYNYISISLVVGGFLCFISQYFFYGRELWSVIFLTSVLLLVGIIIQIILRLKIHDDTQDIITVISICIIIPVITFKFIVYASITIWAFPFIFIIIFLVFNKPVLMGGLAVSILLTQVVVWLNAPDVMVRVEGSDHIVRVGLFGIAIWIAFYVNRIYRERLKRNSEQIRFQQLISEISSDFVTVDQYNINEKINNTLKLMGEFFAADQVFILSLSPAKKTLICTHAWSNKDYEYQIAPDQDEEIGVFAWSKDLIANSQILIINDINQLPPQASAEQQFFRQHRLHSFMAIPITKNNQLFGLLGFALVNTIKQWPNEAKNVLAILSNLLADGLIKSDAEKKINFMAYYDQLTRLPNRVLFGDRLNQAIRSVNRADEKIGIIFLDLDLFKTVNDTLGHEGGDQLLGEVARKLTRCVREIDLVSRFGGDEFVIMVNNVTDNKDLIEVLDNIMNLFKQPFIINRQEFFITTSAGISVFPIDGEDTNTLIKNADIAMCSAKEGGKNQYRFCSSSMKDAVKNKVRMTNDLYRAQERNELIIYYQPQINLQSKEIVGFEALIRWNHPDLGMLSPGSFIPLAEQTRLINSIGEWVLKTACRQNKIWQDMGFAHLSIAVNLSIHQMRNPNFIEKIDKILKDTGLAPQYLELEITESVAATNDTDYIIGVLNKLKGLGVGVSIDDFGTEYSSLNRIKMLPIDRIKLDMHFVHGISVNNKDEAVLQVIILLAKKLGLTVIAEGVETEIQSEFLSSLNCDEVQGYYYYKPMPTHEIDMILRHKYDSPLLPA